MSELSGTVTELSGAISTQADPWRAAAATQIAAWQSRLTSADPLVGGEPVFPESSPSSSSSHSGEPGTALATATQSVMDAATAALENTREQPMRLLLLSVLLATKGLTNSDSLPGELTSEPYRYPDITDKEALGAALTHVWALLQALEKGLGLIGSKDPQHASLLARHTELKGLRDRLIAALGIDRPRQDGHYELPAITDASTLRTAQMELELQLLNGLAGAVATSGEKEWLEETLTQVPRVQALGGRLPVWPGWVNS